MAHKLFLAEALRATSDHRFGSPMALLPQSWWVLSGFFAIVGVATVIFLATATFPRKESAAGILRYSLGEQRISAPRAGIVTEIRVGEGQLVAAGDVLAYVTTEQHLAGGGVHDARLVAAIAVERTMLGRRLAALDASEPLQAASLHERIDGIAEQLVELRAGIISRQEHLKLSRESLTAASG